MISLLLVTNSDRSICRMTFYLLFIFDNRRNMAVERTVLLTDKLCTYNVTITSKCIVYLNGSAASHRIQKINAQINHQIVEISFAVGLFSFRWLFFFCFGFGDAFRRSSMFKRWGNAWTEVCKRRWVILAVVTDRQQARLKVANSK